MKTRDILETTPLNTTTTLEERDGARLTVARNAQDRDDCRRLLAVLGLIELFWQCPACNRDRNFDDGPGTCKCGTAFQLVVRANEE